MRQDRGWTAGRRSLVTLRLLVYRHVGEDGAGSSGEDTHTHTHGLRVPPRETDRRGEKTDGGRFLNRTVASINTPVSVFFICVLKRN